MAIGACTDAGDPATDDATAPVDAVATVDAVRPVDATRAVDVATTDSTPPVSCGCPADPVDGNCVSVNVFEWVDRAAIGPGVGLVVYVVSDPDYGSHLAPLATGTPDATGLVVIEGFTPMPGQDTYIVLDDPNGSIEDNWTHTGVGPIAVPGIAECIDAPALTRAHGDTYLSDLGFPRDEGPILVGTVVLEIADQDGELRDMVDVTTSPLYLTKYFTADRQNLGSFASTTASGAVSSGAVYFCSPSCTNIACACGEPLCGELPAERGGTGHGFLFATMPCHRP